MAQLTVTRVGPTDVGALERFLDSDPVDNVYLRSELRLMGTAAPWWCVVDGGELRAALLAGPLTVPFIPDVSDAPRLAEQPRAPPRPPHLMVGPRAAVLALHGVPRAAPPSLGRSTTRSR